MTNLGAAKAILTPITDAVIAMDRTSRITEFDPAAEKMFGYRRAEALGSPVADVIMPTSLRATFGAELAGYLSAGASGAPGTRVEIYAAHRDGTAFPAEVTLVSAGTGSTQSFSAYIRDISERKESEHFRLLVAAVKDHAIFMLDSTGRVAERGRAGGQGLHAHRDRRPTFFDLLLRG